MAATEEKTFEEVSKKFGKDFECKIANEYTKPSYEPNLYGDEGIITPRKYFIYKNALEDIIRGKEVDLTLLEM